MGGAARIPGKGWYALAGVIALGAVIAVGGVAVWVYLNFEASTPFLAPGRQTIELKHPGAYFVWNDYQALFEGRRYDALRDFPAGARISVTERATGKAVPLESAGNVSSDTGSTKSVAVSQFNAERPGSYDVAVEGRFPPRVFSVGRNAILTFIAAGFGAFALIFLGFGAALAIAGWTFLRREEARRSVAPPAALGVAGAASADDKSLKNFATIVYALQVAGFFVGITFIAGVVINYLKRQEAEGTWLESHFRWQIRTFWLGLLWSVIGVALVFVLVGIPVLVLTTAWMLYRVIKGWIALEDGRPLPA